MSQLKRWCERKKSLAKQISCDCKCRFDSKTINSNLKWNSDKFYCECEKPLKQR